MTESNRLICGRSRDELLKKIADFHSHVAPGLVIGAIMVDLAQEIIGPGVEADAVVETRKCLPDAIQIFTPCTIGNGWMTVVDWNKFALTLYDKHRLTGCRVWLDIDKARNYKNLYKWFMGLASKQELPLNVLLDTIFEADRAMLSHQRVRHTGFPYEKQEPRPQGVCPVCGESGYLAHGPECLACQGAGYYQPMD